MRKQTQSKLDPHAEVLRQWFTPKEQGGEGLTLDQAVARLSERYAVKVSVSRLSDWWRAEQERALQDKILSDIATGARLNKEIEAQFAKNPAPELDSILRLFKTLTQQLAVNGQADPELLKLAGSFASLILDERKAAGSFALRKRELDFNERKFAEQLKTDLEKGLDALFQEVKGNPEARALFEKFKAVVTKATA